MEFERLHSRIDDLVSTVTDIRVLVERNTVTLEKNTDDVERHIRRTDILEERMEQALAPSRYFKWFAGTCGVLSLLVGLAYGILQLMQALGPYITGT